MSDDRPALFEHPEHARSRDRLRYYGGTLLLEKDIDLSLENAIGYKAATIAIGARVEGGCGDVNPTDVYAELAGLRIVGTK